MDKLPKIYIEQMREGKIVLEEFPRGKEGKALFDKLIHSKKKREKMEW